MKTYIYALIDPITNIPRYIGKANDLNKRLKGHVNKVNCKKSKLNKKESWIKSLLNNNLKPTIEKLDYVPVNEWKFWEMFYISLFKSWGFNLTNGDNGGLGTGRLTEEIRNKIRFANTGKIQSQETRDKISLKLKNTIPWNLGISKYDKGSTYYSRNKGKLKKGSTPHTTFQIL